MNLNFSPAAWIALTCIIVAVTLSAISLWSAWRRSRGPLKPSPPPSDQHGPSFTRSWQKEEEQISELARRVKDLKKDRR